MRNNFFPRLRRRKEQRSGQKPRRRLIRFEQLETRNVLASITGLGLANDTGASASDLITNDPTFSGVVTWTSPETTGVTVEADLHLDGQIDDSHQLTTSGDSFYFDPDTVDPALVNFDGGLFVKVRAIEHQPGGDVVGNWEFLTFVLDRVAPSVTGFTPSGAEFEPAFEDVAANFSEPIDPASMTGSTVWLHSNGTQTVPPQSRQLIGTSTASLSYALGDITAHSYDMTVTGVKDVAGNEMENTATKTWVNKNPMWARVINMDLRHDTGFSDSDYITNIGEVQGTVTWVSPDVEIVHVEFDHNSDGVVDGTVEVWFTGDYLWYTPEAGDPALENWEGTLPLRYRTRSFEPAGIVMSGWNPYYYVLDRVPPTIASTTPTDGGVANSLTSATITFNETIEHATVTDFYIQDSLWNQPAQSISMSGATVTITPDSPLDPENYKITMGSVKDLAGNLQSNLEGPSWRVNAPPVIESVHVELAPSLWLITGAASDDLSLHGQTLLFGGVLEGYTAEVETSTGAFFLNVLIDDVDTGTATVVVTDVDGLMSEIELFAIGGFY